MFYLEKRYSAARNENQNPFNLPLHKRASVVHDSHKHEQV